MISNKVILHKLYRIDKTYFFNNILSPGNSVWVYIMVHTQDLSEPDK